jgi:hypothetical protein
MSLQIPTSFVQQYSANVQLLYQQKGSKLRGSVRHETIVGKQAFFDQIGATAARRRTSRHSDTPRMDTPHARRRCATEDFDWADMIDQEDKVKTLADFTSPYAENAAMAMGRATDEVIVDAMRGTSFTDETGSTPVILPTAQKVPVGTTGMSDRACYAWQRNQVVLGVGRETQSRITERADKNYATQVFYSMGLGATRMQEVAVVEIACKES